MNFKIARRFIFPIALLIIVVLIIANGNITFDDIAVELLGAIIFAFVFYMAKQIFYPSIELSSNIVHREDDRYFFKLINYSIGDVADVKIEANLLEYSGPNNATIRYTQIGVSKDYIRRIPGLITYNRRVNSNAYLLSLRIEFIRTEDPWDWK